ncbi:SixA phosphatase family protein [Nocardioides marmotae]|uniref:SixA phosphatase family protein n=1 Tax=Nocardioides marmotae TaxID=2663857 RepID=UPI0013255DB8|nr:histidine phosphatase family protein [Nocardioides marmotae]MBC9731690.1 histidine phosphatase family protein [Nocardioides marmotae]MTB82812.1 histidine phosphatase family protein [Nocardioides marmotae]
MSGDEGTRTLVVVRHAKAEADGPTDAERRLAESGHVAASAVGTWLAEQGIVPDHALVSGAVRTLQTWDDIADAAGWDLEPEVEETLYAAGPESALDLVRAVPADVRTLVVVGHNPTMGTLAQLLDDGEGDVEAGNRLALGYPTSATTVLSYDGDWDELADASASVVAFFVGA